MDTKVRKGTIVVRKMRSTKARTSIKAGGLAETTTTR